MKHKRMSKNCIMNVTVIHVQRGWTATHNKHMIPDRHDCWSNAVQAQDKFLVKRFWHLACFWYDSEWHLT
jgi:hypothetical protein